MARTQTTLRTLTAAAGVRRVLIAYGCVGFTTYFALKEGLEAILRRPVDVVSIDRLENPYVRQSVLAQREELYAA